MRWIYQRQQQFLLPLFCTIASLCLTLMMYNRYCGLFFLLSLSSYFCCLDSTDMTLLDLSHTLRCLKLDRYMGFYCLSDLHASIWTMVLAIWLLVTYRCWYLENKIRLNTGPYLWGNQLCQRLFIVDPESSDKSDE